MKGYGSLKDKVQGDMTDAEFKKKLRIAKLYHNPRNYDTGHPICKELGVNRLFDGEIKRYGYGKRYYFRFHDHSCEEMVDHQKVAARFRKCRNFEKYAEVWRAHAPKEVNSAGMYLVMLTEITVEGALKEKKTIEKLIAQGKTVEKSSFFNDYNRGIDLIVDGKPVQVKSAGTIASAGDGGEEWV